MGAQKDQPFLLLNDELRAKHLAILDEYPRPRLDPTFVPPELHDLIPYAEHFGIADDLLREEVVTATPFDMMQTVKAKVEEHEDELDDWLAGPESYDDDPSDEYLAFSALRFATDFV